MRQAARMASKFSSLATGEKIYKRTLKGNLFGNKYNKFFTHNSLKVK